MRFSLFIASLMAALAPQVTFGRAVRPTINLRYTRGAGAERCPEEATLRSAVSARLGRDPWDPAAKRTIVVAVAREGASLRARVELRGGDGRISGLREMTSVGQDCIELAAAVQLAISMAIDPLSFSGSTPAASKSGRAQTNPGPPARVEARPAETPAPPAGVGVAAKILGGAKHRPAGGRQRRGPRRSGLGAHLDGGHRPAGPAALEALFSGPGGAHRFAGLSGDLRR